MSSKTVFASEHTGDVDIGSRGAPKYVPVHNLGMGLAPSITMPDGKIIMGSVTSLGTAFDIPRTPGTDIFGFKTTF